MELKNVDTEDIHISEENPQDEYFQEYKLQVDKGQATMRIDKFLVMRIERISRTKFQAAADAGCVLVNEKPVKSSYKIAPLDEIRVIIPRPYISTELKPENIPLDILYEDEDLLILNKPAGLVVHPGVGNYTGTLVNALLYHFKDLPNNGDSNKPGVVHRLDKDTSGVMVIAKNDFSMAHLAKQFFDRTMHRKYVSLVWGDIEEPEGRVEGHIGRHLRDRMRMAVFPDGDNGKAAATNYKVLERFGYTTLVECKLETGRTHQIRVHMGHIGHLVFNDARYDGNKIQKGTIYTKYKQFVENCFEVCPRQALHAQTLGIIHPRTGASLFFEQPMPDDMQQLVEKWRTYIKGRLDKTDIEKSSEE